VVAAAYVILNEVNRRTKHVQRPLAGYAMQGGGQQAQRKLRIYFIEKQILRQGFAFPQNDKTVHLSLSTFHFSP
jgi:hypothetical protein